MKTLLLSGFFITTVVVAGCATTTPPTTLVNTQTATVQQTATPTHEETKTSFVANEEAAIEIAVKAWVPIYGKEQIEQEKPYVAKLKKGVWIVTGSLPRDWDGGVAIARISQKDGKVLETAHSK